MGVCDWIGSSKGGVRTKRWDARVIYRQPIPIPSYPQRHPRCLSVEEPATEDDARVCAIFRMPPLGLLHRNLNKQNENTFKGMDGAFVCPLFLCVCLFLSFFFLSPGLFKKIVDTFFLRFLSFPSFRLNRETGKYSGCWEKCDVNK